MFYILILYDKDMEQHIFGNMKNISYITNIINN